MAQLTNLSALREPGAVDDLVRRVHHEKQDFVIEDLTMPVRVSSVLSPISTTPAFARYAHSPNDWAYRQAY